MGKFNIGQFFDIFELFSNLTWLGVNEIQKRVSYAWGLIDMMSVNEVIEVNGVMGVKG